MRKRPSSFTHSRDQYLRMVRSVGEHFTRPDDDWAPVMFVESRRGIEIVAIGPDYLASAEAKEKLALEVIPSFVSERRGYRVALVTSSWFTSYALPAGLDLQLPPLLSEPGRHEVVTVQVADIGRQELWFAKIERFKIAPPRLGEWQLFEGDLVGRFAVSLRRAFRPQG
jgi:hypothetical protein